MTNNDEARKDVPQVFQNEQVPFTQADTTGSEPFQFEKPSRRLSSYDEGLDYYFDPDLKKLQPVEQFRNQMLALRPEYLRSLGARAVREGKDSIFLVTLGNPGEELKKEYGLEYLGPFIELLRQDPDSMLPEHRKQLDEWLKDLRIEQRSHLRTPGHVRVRDYAYSVRSSPFELRYAATVLEEDFYAGRVAADFDLDTCFIKLEYWRIDAEERQQRKKGKENNKSCTLRNTLRSAKRHKDLFNKDISECE